MTNVNGPVSPLYIRIICAAYISLQFDIRMVAMISCLHVRFPLESNLYLIFFLSARNPSSIHRPLQTDPLLNMAFFSILPLFHFCFITALKQFPAIFLFCTTVQYLRQEL